MGSHSPNMALEYLNSLYTEEQPDVVTDHNICLTFPP